MDKPPKTSKDLQDAINSDAKRLAIDAAKKRAVSQKVDYDTFKNMVLVAHLKPLQAASCKREGGMAPAWCLDADGQQLTAESSPAEPTTSGRTTLGIMTPKQAPSTSGDFAREWRRNCPSQQDKLMLLQLCGAERLSGIFRVEVDSALLGEILLVLDAYWGGCAGIAGEEACSSEACRPVQQQEAAFVMEVLEALAGAGRFALTMRLLAGKPKQAAARLLDALHTEVHSSPDSAMLLQRLQCLRQQYGCSAKVQGV